MPRFALIALITSLALAACGSTITITLPDGARSSNSALPAGFAKLLSPAEHAFRFSADGEPVRRGGRSERFELRDGDCGGGDCGNPWARAEIREEADTVKARLGQDIWYGWSFHNATIASGTRDTSLGTVLGQWKLDGATPAVFRIVQTPLESGDWSKCDPRVCTPGGAANEDVVVHLDDISTARNWGPAKNSGNICRLFSLDAQRGRWVDIVVNTNFSPDDNGYLRVWVNGQLKCNYYGPLISDPKARKGDVGPSHRRGIFASSTRRFTETRPGAPRPTLIAFYDEFLVGETRGDVDTAAREKSSARPKD